MCQTCGFLVSTVEEKSSEPQTPGICPNCAETAGLKDVTCRRPECGGEQYIDPLLVGAVLRALIDPEQDDAAEKAAPPPTDIKEYSLIFSGLNKKEKDKVLALGNKETISPNSTIFSEGESAEKLYIMEQGRVAIKALLKEGRWVPVCAVTPGDVFGWSCLVPPYRFTASAVVLEETVVTSFLASDLRKLFVEEPGIGYYMMQNTAQLVTSRLKNVRIELLGIVYM